MQTKFKRHDSIILLKDPDPEYVEYHNEDDPNFKETPIKKGMKGKVNMMLSNGRYHLQILDKKGDILAYVPVDEEDIEKE